MSLGVFLVFQAVLPERASQTRLGEQEDGEQHVTDPCATVRQHASPLPDLGLLLLVCCAT